MANHTSPIDVIILASDGYYAMVRHWLCLLRPGRLHGGSKQACCGAGSRQQESFEHAELLFPA